MKLFKIVFMFSLACSGYVNNNAKADTVMFQCKLANGQMSYADRPCGEKQQSIAKKRLKSDPEITPVHNPNKYDEERYYRNYHYYYVKRDNPFEQIERNKQAQQQKAWDNAKPHVITPVVFDGYSRFQRY
jgi:hypothetical protein